MAFALRLANLVLRFGVDIGVIVVDHRLDVMRLEPFHDGRGAWRTAGVQQHPLASLRYYDGAE